MDLIRTETPGLYIIHCKQMNLYYLVSGNGDYKSFNTIKDAHQAAREAAQPLQRCLPEGTDVRLPPERKPPVLRVIEGGKK